MDTGPATVIAAAIGAVALVANALITRTAKQETPPTISVEGSAGAPSSNKMRPVRARTRWLYVLAKVCLSVIYAISVVLLFTFGYGLVEGDVSGVNGGQQQLGTISSGIVAALFVLIIFILRKHDSKFRLGIHIDAPVQDEWVSTQTIIRVQGTYRMYPRPADRLVVFHREGTLYYPQAPILFDRNSSLWEARVWVSSHPVDSEHELIIASISRDLEVGQRFHTRVHGEIGRWIGIEMATQPPGFEVLASVRVVPTTQEKVAMTEDTDGS